MMTYLLCNMTGYEVKQALENLVLLVDTREQPTQAFRKRVEGVGLPYERCKLDFGDYSIKTVLDNGEVFSLADSVCIERKMSLDEICNCYCKDRARFSREFERAKEKGAKIYLLIENANWENIINGKYRSRMSSQALTASITAWLSRYNCQLILCKAESTARLMREILLREMKERLEAYES